MNNLLVQKIYKSRKNLLEQLKSRNIDTTHYENFNLSTINYFIKNNHLDMFLESKDKYKIYVKYHLTKKCSPSNLYEYSEDLFRIEKILDKKDELIIITKDKPNDTLINIIKELYIKEKIYINIFSLSSLQFNILNHKLVPKHIILNDKDWISEDISGHKSLSNLSVSEYYSLLV